MKNAVSYVWDVTVWYWYWQQNQCQTKILSRETPWILWNIFVKLLDQSAEVFLLLRYLVTRKWQLKLLQVREVVVQEICQAKEELLKKEMLTFLLIIIPHFWKSLSKEHNNIHI